MLDKVIAWFRRRREAQRAALMLEEEVVVTFDDAGIAATYPDGKRQALAWSDVQCIAVETNDSGPWGADVWWLLEGESTRCSYPGGATGDEAALAEFSQRFPDFDYAAVIEAMGSTSNARFVCWQRRDER